MKLNFLTNLHYTLLYFTGIFFLNLHQNEYKNFLNYVSLIQNRKEKGEKYIWHSFSLII